MGQDSSTEMPGGRLAEASQRGRGQRRRERLVALELKAVKVSGKGDKRVPKKIAKDLYQRIDGELVNVGPTLLAAGRRAFCREMDRKELSSGRELRVPEIESVVKQILDKGKEKIAGSSDQLWCTHCINTRGGIGVCKDRGHGVTTSRTLAWNRVKLADEKKEDEAVTPQSDEPPRKIRKFPRRAESSWSNVPKDDQSGSSWKGKVAEMGKQLYDPNNDRFSRKRK